MFNLDCMIDESVPDPAVETTFPPVTALPPAPAFAVAVSLPRFVAPGPTTPATFALTVPPATALAPFPALELEFSLPTLDASAPVDLILLAYSNI